MQSKAGSYDFRHQAPCTLWVLWLTLLLHWWARHQWHLRDAGYSDLAQANMAS